MIRYNLRSATITFLERNRNLSSLGMILNTIYKVQIFAFETDRQQRNSKFDVTLIRNSVLKSAKDYTTHMRTLFVSQCEWPSHNKRYRNPTTSAHWAIKYFWWRFPGRTYIFLCNCISPVCIIQTAMQFLSCGRTTNVHKNKENNIGTTEK